MRKFKFSGQSMAELALVLAFISAGILAMQLYIKYGLQARYRDGVTYLFSEIKKEKGATRFDTVGQQYDPYYSESKMTQNKKAEDNNVEKKGFPDSGINDTTYDFGVKKVSTVGYAD